MAKPLPKNIKARRNFSTDEVINFFIAARRFGLARGENGVLSYFKDDKERLAITHNGTLLIAIFGFDDRFVSNDFGDREKLKDMAEIFNFIYAELMENANLLGVFNELQFRGDVRRPVAQRQGSQFCNVL